ncbi:Transposable element P transposase [Frankliniella fusca]|uniref:Transposable element P transposase n=1 Tax=Frankliniella fusca TaxID=407009 RepID=A0AAE1LB59_9NEOP|nr:Transposable element P transposase [Frankliniella fusca]
MGIIRRVSSHSIPNRNRFFIFYHAYTWSETPSLDERSSIDLSGSMAPSLLTSTPATKRATCLDFRLLQSVVNTLRLPSSMWGTHTSKGQSEGNTLKVKSNTIVHSRHLLILGIVLAYTRMNNNFNIDVKVIFKNSLQPKIYINNREINYSPNLSSKTEVESLLDRINSWKLCVGYTDTDSREKKWAEQCPGYLQRGIGRPILRCGFCNSKRKAVKYAESRESRKSDDSSVQVKRLRDKVRNLRKADKRRKAKVTSLRNQLKLNREELAKVPQRKVESIIATVPEEQKEMRLRPEWVFQENTFSLLEEKAQYIPVSDRHGTLLLDEMALTERVHFEGDSLKVHGLVNLGKYTPDEDKDKRGDHALVIMFQPFRGQWVQAIGAFLSAGAVKGPVLQKLVLEGTILLENAGYHVDCVTTDGATWNRSMWNLFGLSKNDNSCQHPVDQTRRLHFGSDFPHLMKRLWTRVVNQKILELPEGTIKLSHYEAVVKLEEGRGIRAAFTLTRDHLNPTTYQRMNVRMAMQFFSNTVASAMEDYQLRGEEGLSDSQPTINFMRRINAVVEAMNSRSPADGLRPDENTVQQQVLRDFLTYLEKMDEMAQAKADLIREKKLLAVNAEHRISVGHIDEITKSTYLGFRVTVNTALDLIKYLHDNFNYQYLMTRRLNQDALEMRKFSSLFGATEICMWLK